MGLGLQTEGGGDYANIIKYDARAGRCFRVDRAQDSSGNWQTDNVEITDNFMAIFDMENIQVGFMLFAAGQAPSMTMVPLGDPMPHRPSDQHKQGFKLMLKLGASSGGDVREFASQAKAVIAAIDKLHDAYKEGLKANPGKLPVVAIKGATPITTTGKGQSSTNYSPKLEIVAWADRPADLTADGSAPKQTPTTDPLPEATPKADAPKQLVNVGAEF